MINKDDIHMNDFDRLRYNNFNKPISYNRI